MGGPLRFDLVTIFPQYFAALDVSLIGKARKKGDLQLEVHNLRDWASGPHLAVDDTPAGGGAGMVMRADVWGEALDELLAEPLPPGASGRRVLAIPTPAGVPFTQAKAADLAGAQQIVVACGRYEGPDARVAEHYRAEGVEVFEFSLGDYVLNGGEVAALALVEAVGRLREGVLGNPESLDEESHVAGLLEYPAYTLPRSWRGLEIPAVLLSGDHGRIKDWRRRRSLERTAKARPDLIERLDAGTLTSSDRAVLAAAGYLVQGEVLPVTYREAAAADLPAISALAGTTFPDACPPDMRASDIADFIAAELSIEAFQQHHKDPEALLWVADSGGEIVSYTLSHRRLPEPLGNAPTGSAYLSKCYTERDYRGSGVTAAIMDATISEMENRWGSAAVALGTNIRNKRAAAFYRRRGFKKAGRRTFTVGGAINTDNVFVLDLTPEEA